ncbi:helix-turn-helix transcriptional regulator [Pseudophaeobacter arcticus]|jgi:DNA-binding CsgD family transcriptional regulator|uniref:helix-turn-helix transcriptional regulator n=2 Tax=Pseudophaeobacter arcticus TaxID=385492 RepID=UPI0039E4300F
MRQTLRPTKTRERRATVVAGLILLQAMCALFFIGDVVKDFREDGQFDNPHLILESVAAASLIAGVIFLMFELRGLLARMSEMQRGLDIARGHLAEIIDAFFAEWKLTAAERDVAIMMLKGVDNDTIARVRKTAPGTVRAQATRIYSKSATDGRAQFISLFMEELLSGDIAPDENVAPESSENPNKKTAGSPKQSSAKELT